MSAWARVTGALRIAAVRPCGATARALLLTLAVLGICSAAARADNQISQFAVTTSTQQAGAHPDMQVRIVQRTGTYQPGNPPGDVPYPLEYPRQYAVSLPAGVLGNPTAFPTCTDRDVNLGGADCPNASQLGLLHVFLAPGSVVVNGSQQVGPVGDFQAPLINLAPNPGQVARFGSTIVSGEVVLHINIGVRDTSDYGLTATVTGIPSTLPFIGAQVDLWGVPSASAHDGERVSCWDSSAGDFLGTNGPCTAPGVGTAPFLDNPTSCSGGASTASLAADFYGDPQTSYASTEIPATTGCDAVPFSPALSLSSSGAVGQPDAFDADVAVAQPDPSDPSSIATAAVRDVSVRLPQGVSLSPGVADGLTSCTDRQFAKGSDTPQACPAASQIGTVSVTTPLLSGPLTGEVFVGQQESSDPSSGRMYRLLLDAIGQGVDLKLAGNVSADPSTGQLTATFSQNPEVPFSDLKLTLKGGPRAPLANPQTCGIATSSWSISSYAEPAMPVTGRSSFPVTGNCGLAAQFSPALSAGTQSDQAGASSPFSLTLTRPDGQQAMSGVPFVSLPIGLNATLKGVEQCSDAEAGAARCPADSQVGVASVTSGTGPAPFALTGQPIYLTGPYKGGPFGLAEVVHAVAGPFDLGTVVVRQSLRVDPIDAQVTIVSDPLPTMLGGVPLNLRSISLNVNRPGFMRSPTSCTPRHVSADVQGTAPGTPATVGAGYAGYASSVQSTVHLSEAFQAGGCDKLRFSPRLRIGLAATHRTAPGSHPRLTATLTQAAGQANLRSARVTLPLALALDPNNSRHVCSVEAAARVDCPAGTVVGSATADTRILPHALTGKVYLVQGVRYDSRHRAHKTLPTLLIPLRGADGVAIDLTAKTSVDGRSRLVTTFPAIPDAAIARFDLAITGGRKGILVVTGSRSLCKVSRAGLATERGQSGKVHYGTFGMRVGTACRARAR